MSARTPGLTLAAALSLSALIAAAAHAQSDAVLQEVAEVSEVTVRAHWVDSREELNRAVRKYRKRRARRAKLPDAAGFSRLYRLKDGTYLCEIWAERPMRWNDSQRIRSVGHEILHCFGYVHQ